MYTCMIIYYNITPHHHMNWVRVYQRYRYTFDTPIFVVWIRQGFCFFCYLFLYICRLPQDITRNPSTTAAPDVCFLPLLSSKRLTLGIGSPTSSPAAGGTGPRRSPPRSTEARTGRRPCPSSSPSWPRWSSTSIYCLYLQFLCFRVESSYGLFREWRPAKAIWR